MALNVAAMMVTLMVVDKERPKVVARARLMEMAKAKLKEAVRLLMAVMVTLTVVEKEKPRVVARARLMEMVKAKLKEAVRVLVAVRARLVVEAVGQRSAAAVATAAAAERVAPLAAGKKTARDGRCGRARSSCDSPHRSRSQAAPRPGCRPWRPPAPWPTCTGRHGASDRRAAPVERAARSRRRA